MIDVFFVIPYLHLRLAYYRMLLQVAPPLHQDVPDIVLTIRHLEHRINWLWAIKR